MPEMPELEALARGLSAAVAGRRVVAVAVGQPAVVRTADPPLDALAGQRLACVWRRGKLLGVEAERHTCVIHLMQAGRLALVPASPGRPGRTTALALRLDDDRELRLREAATRHRAGVHLLDAEGLARHAPLADLGPEPIGLSPEEWRARLSAPPGRLHRALRDGRRVAGIGRVYAVDVMWAAALPPFARTDRLGQEEWERLARAADLVLGEALARAVGRITTALSARESRATLAHGHAGEPCLRCARPLARVAFEDFELVYCPGCQTGGRVHADRRTSRFLR